MSNQFVSPTLFETGQDRKKYWLLLPFSLLHSDNLDKYLHRDSIDFYLIFIILFIDTSVIDSHKKIFRSIFFSYTLPIHIFAYICKRKNCFFSFIIIDDNPEHYCYITRKLYSNPEIFQQDR